MNNVMLGLGVWLNAHGMGPILVMQYCTENEKHLPCDLFSVSPEQITYLFVFNVEFICTFTAAKQNMSITCAIPPMEIFEFFFCF